MLINKKYCRQFALACAKTRYHKFSRVSKSFLTTIESITKEAIRQAVERHPSVGKTLTVLILTLALTDAEGIRCLMGEARGESYICQVATAEAIRNRGTTKGVYGCSAKFNEPAWVWKRAEKAWHESATTNLVKDADHWESTDFKVPYWAKSMTVTAQHGKHVFYKRS